MPTLPDKKRFRCEILSWGKVAKDTKSLAALINKSRYDPHIIVAIGRGGYIPARMLCDYLFIKDLTSIKVEHWGIAATPDEQAVIKFPLCTDIKNKRVLVVDDITDTGDTLRISLEYMQGFNPEDVKTAVLIHKTTSDLLPDYYVRKVTQWRWIIFPWHVWEDISGFLKKMKASGIDSEEAMVQELGRRYGITVSIKIVQEILAGMK